MKYVTGYEGFSPATELQSGNYIAIHAEVLGFPNAVITAQVVNPVRLESDGVAVLRIADKDLQTITVVATVDGHDPVQRVFALSGLVCAAA